MKKISLFIVLISLFFITGCNCQSSKHLMKVYKEENEWNEYLYLFYEEINTEGRKYVGVDLRSKEAYETSHLRQFQNYDLNKGNVDELNSWLKSNYSSKYIIYIYIEALSDVSMFDSVIEKFKEVHIYIGEYSSLETLGEELFIFDSGPYDCNC